MNFIKRKPQKVIIGSFHLNAMLLTSLVLLTSCSQMRDLLSSEKETEIIKKDAALTVPPILRLPSTQSQKSNPSNAVASVTHPTSKTKGSSNLVDKRDYFIVVGTYPSQDQALSTFVRLSSIGLPHATMESRSLKTGKLLHMVRLGPFHKQSEIDRVKDILVSDGLSQFKVVVN
ncbi:MAG: SPOR domain-containing protein [Cocleimonas sp.]|nr:SPOR domain-containing protein [Cocleimonas sp.]